MREIQASEAKTHLPRLLDDVEAGETLIITRHGRPVARLVPEADMRLRDASMAVAEIQAARKIAPKITVDEIIGSIREGRKY